MTTTVRADSIPQTHARLCGITIISRQVGIQRKHGGQANATPRCSKFGEEKIVNFSNKTYKIELLFVREGFIKSYTFVLPRFMEL